MKPIMVVGTSAPRRRQHMTDAFSSQYELHFVSPDIDEKQYRSSDPQELTRLISTAKMKAVRERIETEMPSLASTIAQRPGSVAVTFDQVVVWNKEIREKPESVEVARAFIRDYSDGSLDTVQTTCLTCFSQSREVTGYTGTTTYYRPLPDAVVDRVVARGECMHTAGAFVVEDVDMHQHMIKVDPGNEIEVQGVSESTIRRLLKEVQA